MEVIANMFPTNVFATLHAHGTGTRWGTTPHQMQATIALYALDAAVRVEIHTRESLAHICPPLCIKDTSIPEQN